MFGMEKNGHAQVVIKFHNMKGLLIFFLTFLGCHKISKTKIVDAKPQVNIENYFKDKVIIKNKLSGLLNQHVGFFSSKEYNNYSEIIVDTIIHNPDFQKMAILIIVKNPTTQQLVPSKADEFYYNATCFIGKKNKESLSLFWMGPNFTNSYDLKKIKKIVRNKFIDDKRFKYNIADNDFWTSDIWKKMSEHESLQKLLEREKREHPENVYEPK